MNESNQESPEVFSFAATAGQFVRMQITSNNGGDINILGEVAFEQQIPEPTTLALLALAGATALLVWRKRL